MTQVLLILFQLSGFWRGGDLTGAARPTSNREGAAADLSPGASGEDTASCTWKTLALLIPELLFLSGKFSIQSNERQHPDEMRSECLETQVKLETG